ncbi:MAG TPA: ABC transporter ATP-binding protein [Methylomusa anaerophila]|uniref:Daunorubicin/doxorubicin resistance ATP-binding protein DrrA n=1 Tax=Methylomusa anaerophila TaxID=1930071 RepID=A0A348ALE1_9FIRM|nr:ABC transporter ATP-binding protein [Methylomusa anaerophila]BBB91889.1 daunorubicin/doxorubicin resistance ATP-binding protein DrrA [Methylomusa anaerophila]HML88380.1 ABC transporter ATP-binding protein [Methylomusa anaerophila]
MIRTEALAKMYGERVALDRVTLDVRQGEIFGLLGPNGAGKTTMIRILTMLTRPTAGYFEINGWQPKLAEQKMKAIMGIVPQHLNLDTDLSVRENLELHGRLHHMAAPDRVKRILELLNFVELKERENDKVQSLSGGMKRRLMIGRALFHEPQILFLDEPTIGLDPQVRRRIWDLIRRLNNENTTVFVTTHYIEEAEQLCNRTAILDKGRLIALDTPADLCQRMGSYVVEWHVDDCKKTQFFHERGEAVDFAGTLAANASIRRSNLEDVFVELTGRGVND